MRKGIVISALIILALFSMSCVCAGDANDTAMASEDNVELDVGNDAGDIETSQEDSSVIETSVDEKSTAENGRTWYVNSSSPYNEGTLERPYNNLMYAIASSSNGDTIMIASGSYTGAKNIGLTIHQTGLTLMKYGDGDAVFDAQQNDRCLNVNSNTIIISGLVFQNGKVILGSGGAIRFNGDLTDSRIDATFRNNHASNDGGAMYFGGDLTNVVINGHYENNTVVLNGGANYFLKTLNNVEISGYYANNSANEGMGGANFFEDNLTDVKLIGNYENNRADIEGGANCFRNVLNHVEIIGDYTNNSGAYGGANIFGSALSDVNITGNYNRNTAKPLKIISIVGGKGGAIYFQNPLTNVKINGKFDANNATKVGGAIYFDKGGDICGCVFVDNNASDFGGALYFNQGDCSISDCVFVNNSAHDFAAIHLPFGVSSVSGCVFVNNSAANAVVGSAWDSFINVKISDNIFLNNDAGYAVINFAYLANLKTDYNWFGSTAEDYKNGVPSPTSEVWLFLDATADPNAISPSASSKVTFKLTAYNRTSQKTFGYDNSRLFPVNLTITQTNGKVDKKITNPGKPLRFTAGVLGTGSVTAAIEGISHTVELRIGKTPTRITASDITATYNANKYLVITLKDANGKALSGADISVDLNGAKNYRTDKNGQVRIPTKGLAPNKYNVKIAFAGNAKYDKSAKNVKVIVNKANSKITAKYAVFKTKTKKYVVTLKSNGKALKHKKVFLTVNGKTYKAVTNSKGQAVFKLYKLNKNGKYKAVITFNGDKYYKNAVAKVKLKVKVPAKSTFKTISKGSKDTAMVKKIQQALKDHGYYLTYAGHYLMVDGDFQDCTERSVMEFQRDHGLAVTGKVDERTARELGVI